MALAHLVVADLMWVSVTMWFVYTLPALLGALFLRRAYILPLAIVALVLAVGSALHYHQDGAPQTWLRVGSAAGIILLAIGLAKAQPITSSPKEDKRTRRVPVRKKIFDASDQENETTGTKSDAPGRPLTMERRKKRNLPSDAAAQMEELELLTRRLIQIQEQQQQTISRELHDNVAQVLTAVNARMTLARTAKAKIPAWLQHELCDLQENIDLALTDIRTLARELRPSLLDHCGFAAALENHVQGVRERTGMDFALQVDGEAAVSFDNESLTHLFRLVQEALQNIEEHSGASRAWLRLAQQEDEMQLEIGDNGRAFTEERLVEAQRDGHLGLLGMRERAELLGGSFLLEAVPDRGTTIRVSVPAPPPPKTTLNSTYENHLSPHC
ncbi:MAG: sensor histidine kinase [Chthoniobacterales bacterium]